MATTVMNQKTKVLPPLRLHVVVSVDDDPLVLSALRRVFQGEQLDLRVTLSVDQALQWVDEGGVSLVISDQRMPVTPGIEMLKEVRKRSPRTQCIILTAYPSHELQMQAESLGIRCLLTKPWDDAALKQTVRILLRESELSAPDTGAPAAPA